jgi:Methyltransferase FkbM domain
MTFPGALRADPPLLEFEQNFTSHCGEDGVIRRAREVIGVSDGWCVEFGAWDGKNASNTYSLIERNGYSAVLIEPVRKRFEALQRTHGMRPGVITLQEFVGFEGPKRLDGILAGTPVPRNFDLLSIDIDGNDYHVWEAVRDYRPKLVVIEFNPTIPNEVAFVQPRDTTVTQGSSLTAIAALARSKGYRLIHATLLNGIFVDEEYFSLFGIEDDSPAALRADLSAVTWLFSTYDGRIHLAGSRQLPWHEVALDPVRFQVLPRGLRTYPPDFSLSQAVAFGAWYAAHAPRAAFGRIGEMAQRLTRHRDGG